MTSETRSAAAGTIGSVAGAEPGARAAEPAAEGTLDLAAHRCFACGDLNAQGIRMAIHVEPDRSWSDVILDPAFQGWEGVAHGGILATLLDEAMAWAIASRQAFAMTARMSVEYRRPVRVGAPLRVEGRVVEAKRRLLRARADVVDTVTGEACAHADGVYVTIPEAQQRELRSRYRFGGITDGPGGERRWRVRQSLPAVDAGGTGVGAEGGGAATGGVVAANDDAAAFDGAATDTSDGVATR